MIFGRIRHKIETNLVYLLILITLAQTVYPATENSLPALIAYQLLYGSLIVAGFLVAREENHVSDFVVAAGLLWLLAGINWAFNPDRAWTATAAFLTVMLFQMLIVYVLLSYIFKASSVTLNVLYAACAVYILLGAIFTPLYGLIETVTWYGSGTHAFVDGSITHPAGPIPWQTFIYYSYATLTTLGYGDVLPVTGWARSLASVEAVIGVLYMTVILARLVGLYAIDRPYGEGEVRSR